MPRYDAGGEVDVPRRLPRWCVEDRDRHGNVRVYLRRPGQPKIRLRGAAWSEEFMAAYREAIAAAPGIAAPGDRSSRPAEGTWRWLCVAYFERCEDFRALDAPTRRARRQILESTFLEPVAPASADTFADFPLRRLTAAALAVLRDRKRATPAAANARVKAIRAVYRYAVAAKLVETSPAEAVAYIKTGSLGHHTWTVDEVRQYEARHPVGSMARLALALLLYTGVRRSDVVLLGRQHVARGWLTFTPRKNAGRAPIVVEVPVLPELAQVIAQSQTGQLTFLVTHPGSRRSQPYTAQGFANRFRTWCDEAGLPKRCTAHGLRKAGATIAAENGATEKQLMAIFGWSDPKMAAHYTKQAERKRMAGEAMGLIDLGRTEYKEVPLTGSGGTKDRKRQ